MSDRSDVFLCSNSSSLKMFSAVTCSLKTQICNNTSILLYMYQQIKFLVSLVSHRQSENYLCLHPPTHKKINKLAPDTESSTCLKKKKKLNEPAVVFANSILNLFQQIYFRVWLCVLCHCMCTTAWVWSEVSFSLYHMGHKD